MGFDYKVDQHTTPFKGQNFKHSIQVPPLRPLGWGARVISRVVEADLRGTLYKVFVKAVALFVLMLLGASIIGFPIALWAASEYRQQLDEKLMRHYLEKNHKSCAHHVHFISTALKSKKGEFAQYLGYSQRQAKSMDTLDLFNEVIVKNPYYLAEHPLT